MLATSSWIRIARLACIVSLSVSTSGQVQGGGGQLPPVAVSPNFNAWNPNELIRTAAGEAAELQVLTMEKRVEIRWILHDPGGGYQGSFTEVFDLSYWPTASYALNGSNEILIAGKRPSNSNTVIEKWVFQPWTQVPSAQDPSPPPQKTVVYDANHAKRRDVISMVGLRPFMDKVIIQFASSGNLYTLNVTNGSIGLLYNTSAIPELVRPRFSALGGNHPDFGNFYSLSDARPGALGHDIIVLYDGNADGTIDSWEILDEEDWNALFGPSINWTEMW